MKILPLIIITMSFALVFSCTKDVIEDDFSCDPTDNVTYKSEIKFILEGSCGAGTSSCHIPGGVFPDYVSFDDTNNNYLENMKTTLDNGQFSLRVVNEMSMPPSYAEPSTALDSIEFYKIRCWIDSGFPIE